jgi:hypothetical protein
MASFFENPFGGGGDAFMLLGDILFSHFEIPEAFNFGGNQMLVTHQLVGGGRVVDAMGRADSDISWSGMFLGEEAELRARALDFLRVQGQQIEFIFGGFIYLVVISSFTPVLNTTYKIPYSITLKVIENLTLPIPIAPPAGYNEAVNDDMQYILNLVGIVDNQALTDAINDLSSSIKASGNLGDATDNQLNLIRDNIATSSAINDSIIEFSEVS